MDFCCNVEKLFTILIGLRSQYECGQFMPSSYSITNANISYDCGKSQPAIVLQVQDVCFRNQKIAESTI